METKQYTTIDKSDWGKGPWQNEPDKMQWQDEDTGLPCLIVRNRLGALCGYVGVATEHPLFGKHYNTPDVSVHGGLTFADVCHPHDTETTGICHVPAEGEPDHIWWFGFDCADCDDFIPGVLAREKKSDFPKDLLHGRNGEKYRPISYVQAECRALARQLHAIKSTEET